LLITLMDDANANLPRVRNVVLAVNLARHSSNDWTDAALPDDISAIEKLLHVTRETLLSRLNVPAEIAQRFIAPDSGSPPEATPEGDPAQ
jgi:hypothetical protein